MDHIIIAALVCMMGLMCITLYWVGGIYYSIRNGINEVVKGLNSIDERLAALESRVCNPPATSGTPGATSGVGDC